MYLDKLTLNNISLNHHSSLRDIIICLNRYGTKIVIIYKKNNFLGIITDGDIRRFMLKKNFSFDSKAEDIVKKYPLVSRKYFSEKIANNILSKKNLQHLPIIKKKRIVALYSKFFSKKESTIDTTLIVMAGGYGKRLGSLTKKIPKGMIKIRRKPILEHVILNAKENGIKKIILSVFYKKNKIINYFNKGLKLGVNIDYLEEKKPLGTAGSLGLIKNIKNSEFIVTSCDVISKIDYIDLINFHKKKKAFATIVVKSLIYSSPYGVVNNNSDNFLSIIEKPKIVENVNAGTYVFNKKVVKIVKDEKFTDMTDLILFLKNKSYKIVVFSLIEDWKDYGSNNNYVNFNK
jgi:dTDP-glucose pyrophosphorylase